MTPQELVDLWYADTNSRCWLSQEALAKLADEITKLVADEKRDVLVEFTEGETSPLALAELEAYGKGCNDMKERCAKFCDNFNPDSYLAREIRKWS